MSSPGTGAPDVHTQEQPALSCHLLPFSFKSDCLMCSKFLCSTPHQHYTFKLWFVLLSSAAWSLATYPYQTVSLHFLKTWFITRLSRGFLLFGLLSTNLLITYSSYFAVKLHIHSNQTIQQICILDFFLIIFFYFLSLEGCWRLE